MAAAAPGTLAELAALAGMEESLFAEFKESDFEELAKDLGLSVPVRVRLRSQFRELRTAAVVVTAQARFQQFLQRVHGADALAGLESVPVSPLPEAVAFIRDRPGTPSRDALAAGVKRAYAKADSLLAEGPDPHGLTRDEMAAINIYTQDDWADAVRNLFAPLNAALRDAEKENARDDVMVYWGYTRLLQHSLFKLPKDGSGTLLRGIKVTWMPLAELRAELQAKQQSGEAIVWWGFSSTSTSMPAVEAFLGQSGPRVIYTLDGGSSARDVRRYSHFQGGQPLPEDERLLPCGTAFTVKTVGSPAPDLLLVTLKQTNDFLIQI